MSIRRAIKPLQMVSLNTFTMPLDTYVDITSSGLPYACDLIRIRNDSKIPVSVSWDGINDHDYIKAHGTLEYYFFNHDYDGVYIPKIAKGTVIYIGNFTGNIGLGGVYLSGFYQDKI